MEGSKNNVFLFPSILFFGSRDPKEKEEEEKCQDQRQGS
jgi:hypothetical protein